MATGELSALEPPVQVVFGADDAYLNPELVRNLARRFTKAEVHLIDDAGHWPQWDQPTAVAAAINAT